MGQNNRARRAAKQRRRARQHGGNGGARRGPAGVGTGYPAGLLLGELVNRRIRGLDAPDEVEQLFLACPVPAQRGALDDRFGHLLRCLFEAGWTPLDLFEVTRRTAPAAAVGHLLEVAARVTAEHPARLVHPRWQAQLDELDARPDRTPAGESPAGESPAGDWARRCGLGWPAAVEQLVTVLGVACALPVVHEVLPQPGRAGAAATGHVGIDDKVLRRVRGLLAKAESTEHDEEADALTAKAQELMTRYSIERAVAEAARPAQPVPQVRRMWIDSPYVAAKSLLAEAVADANHCRTVLSEHWGFVTILGHDTDLDVVELLTGSLLVQATRSMTLAGSQFSRSGASRTRSFRQSFLVAYARRIRERLHESAQSTTAAADAAAGGGLLPVLAARSRIVDDQLDELFPDLVARDVAVSNAAGWGAGRAAADLALFDIRDAIGAQRAG